MYQKTTSYEGSFLVTVVALLYGLIQTKRIRPTKDVRESLGYHIEAWSFTLFWLAGVGFTFSSDKPASIGFQIRLAHLGLNLELELHNQFP